MSNLQLNLRIWSDHILSTIGCPQVLDKLIERGTAVDKVKQVLLALYHLGVKEAREGACEIGLKCSVKTVIEVDYTDLERGMSMRLFPRRSGTTIRTTNTTWKPSWMSG